MTRTARQLIRYAATAFDVPFRAVESGRHDARSVRHAAIYTMRALTPASYREIGIMFGLSENTVAYAVRAARLRMVSDRRYKARVDAMLDALIEVTA